jgi:hypothetical protein
MPKKTKRPRRKQRAGANGDEPPATEDPADPAAAEPAAAGPAGPAGPEVGPPAETGPSRSKRVKEAVGEHGKMAVYIIFVITNLSILIYALIKNNDAPDYDDFKKLKDDDPKVHKTNSDLLRVAGLCILSGAALLLHIMFTKLASKGRKNSGSEKMIYYFSNTCLGVTSLGVLINFYRYVINHVVAFVIVALFLALAGAEFLL